MLIIVLSFLGYIVSIHAQNEINILSFNGDTGFIHESKPDAEQMVKDICAENDWKITTSSDPAFFTRTDLSKFNVIIFNNNCGTEDAIFSEDEQKVLQNYIRSGGGFVGIHCAGAIWHEIGGFQKWYEQLIGTKLVDHPHVQKAKLIVENKFHICTQHLPEEWIVEDEWHRFAYNPRQNVNVLISLDENSYEGKEKMGGDHPFTWYQYYDGGRSFFTSLGHTVAIYKNEKYKKLVEGGITWALGLIDMIDPLPVTEGLLLDLDANQGIELEDGDKICSWGNQVQTNEIKKFIKQDDGRNIAGTGRPKLKLNAAKAGGNNTVVFNRQELVNHQEDAFDHLITGNGYTWFSVMAVYKQVSLLADVNSFFGNLRNSNLDDKGNYEGFWGGVSDDNRLWMGTRNAITFGRWDENNPQIIDSKPLETGKYYLVIGRMEAGTGQAKLELFINGLDPVAEGFVPVNPEANPSKMVIGQERDAINHPGRESFDGEISRFLIYERPLSGEELKMMVNKLMLKYHIQ
jgi:type 1 glutamine amidotransferase